MNPSSPLRVVCFGDSLTAGFQSPTRENPQGRSTPYGDWVQARFGAAVHVVVSGICGEMTAEMLQRFRRDVLTEEPHYVVILGGTNDLGWNGPVDEIMRNLVNMYEQTRAYGATPVPVTVPSLRVEDAGGSREAREWIEGHLMRRLELNALILEYAVSKQLAAVDLFSTTADAASRLLAREYSNDGLHLTTEGYRRFAELLCSEVLAPILTNGN